MSLGDALAVLRGGRWVDLTHAFGPGIPHYEAFPDEQRDAVMSIAADGFLVHRYAHVGQWGTHVDPPSHFHAGGRALDELPVTDMLAPLVVLDVREEAADASFAAGLAVLERHEAEHGRIDPGAFVALLTGWAASWPDVAASHPGWSAELVRVLVEERGVVAIGHDVTSTDPSGLVAAGKTPAETYVLGADRWQIELLANLDQVPARGAVVVATWPKPAGGSGFPARVFAICPG